MKRPPKLSEQEIELLRGEAELLGFLDLNSKAFLTYSYLNSTFINIDSITHQRYCARRALHFLLRLPKPTQEQLLGLFGTTEEYLRELGQT